MLGEVGEGRVDFAFSSCAQYSNLQAERACRSLHIACLGQGQWVFRVDQHCKDVAIGHKLMGELYAFRPHFRAYNGHTSDVAARSVKTSD
jgi:hypothetical protein